MLTKGWCVSLDESSTLDSTGPKYTKARNSLKSLRIHGLLHHGLISEEFEPRFIGSDYYNFWHKPCANKEWRGLVDIIGVLIDNHGRVIFNLKCRDCGKIDALKTSPQLFRTREQRLSESEVLNLFHLSPKLKARCKPHWWDDV
jgi:hypothetical protein